MSCEPVIEARGLGKCYAIYDRPQDRLAQAFWGRRRKLHRDFWALRDVSLAVQPGETLAVIGRNGSGKSTLLQLLTGTLTPSEGEARVRGRVAALLELGAGFNPEFTGRENVLLNGTILGLSREALAERFDAIAAFADLGPFLEQPVRTYSSGMYVRLAFAVAIHTDPEVLIIDEALAVGDFPFQQKCNRVLQEDLAHVTKLLVTHDLAAVSRLATRAVVLEQGRLAFVGDPAEALTCYQQLCRAGQAPPTAPEPAPGLAAVTPEASWEPVAPERLSGRLGARIEACTVAVDGDATARLVRPGQRVAWRVRVRVEERLAAPILGYQVQDRFGTVIFGENSARWRPAMPPLGPGLHELGGTLTWPTLAPERYGLTFGLGDGHDPHLHEIQCWAHNVVVLEHGHAVPMHGLFNVPLHPLEAIGGPP
ncbi:MAG: ABC transporter ATP-binding protein [Candidatus Sericytochromatia bacterium]|nr:ABC transporter ATP-binding protein [Candidatus Sericytochromatia bacterium]